MNKIRLSIVLPQGSISFLGVFFSSTKTEITISVHLNVDLRTIVRKCGSSCIREPSLLWLCVIKMIKADKVLCRSADSPGCFWMVARWMGGSFTLFLSVPDTSQLSLRCCEAQIKNSFPFSLFLSHPIISLHPAILNDCLLIEMLDAFYKILQLALKMLCWLNYMWMERYAKMAARLAIWEK